MRRRSRPRNACQRLRRAVESMPRASREAMLRGIEDNTIIVGAYTDPSSGGICPMLAAHRNGGRTSLASFARSWDRFTNARRPRLATEREVRTLRSYIEMSLLRDEQGTESVTTLANEIRAERAEAAKRAAKAAPEEGQRGQSPPSPGRLDTGERHRASELKHKRFWAWLRPTRRYDEFAENVAAATEQHNEQRAADLETHSVN